MDGLVLLLAGRITTAGPLRTCEAHIQLHLGRQARGSSDEVLKVRQDSTRDDAISTAGPRVMTRRGRGSGEELASRGACSAVRRCLGLRQRVCTVLGICSAAACTDYLPVGTVVRGSSGRKGRMQAEGLGRSTLATLALDHQWLANPSTRERLEGVEGACRAGAGREVRTQ